MAPTGVEDFAAGILVARLHLGKDAERQGKVAGADEDKVDALGRRRSSLAFSRPFMVSIITATMMPRSACGVIIDVVGERAGTASGALADEAGSAQPSRPRAACLRLSISGTITPSAPASSAWPMAKALFSATRARTGISGGTTPIAASRPERSHSPCWRSRTMASGRARPAISASATRAERQPDHAKAVTSVDAVAQTRALGNEHAALRTTSDCREAQSHPTGAGR